MTQSNNHYLEWPEETCGGDAQYPRWLHPGSNLCLDFHGDPAGSELVVFSDGNHHMALLECLDLFESRNPDLKGIFYATAPPGPIIKLLKQHGLKLGNLLIKTFPHVFISPPENLDKLVESDYMSGHERFLQNNGSVLLVRKGNPRGIETVKDLAGKDVRLFISNPETEKASFSIYHETLAGLTSEFRDDPDFISMKVNQGQVQFGNVIHHREAPQAVAGGSADVAIIFYHLALRYTRIFPDTFEIVPLGGTVDNPEPFKENVVAKTHMGLVKDGGKWGEKLLEFLRSEKVKEIYRHHGLRPY